jgi:hypothetical protein
MNTFFLFFKNRFFTKLLISHFLFIWGLSLLTSFTLCTFRATANSTDIPLGSRFLWYIADNSYIFNKLRLYADLKKEEKIHITETPDLSLSHEGFFYLSIQNPKDHPLEFQLSQEYIFQPHLYPKIQKAIKDTLQSYSSNSPQSQGSHAHKTIKTSAIQCQRIAHYPSDLINSWNDLYQRAFISCRTHFGVKLELPPQLPGFHTTKILSALINRPQDSLLFSPVQKKIEKILLEHTTPQIFQDSLLAYKNKTQVITIHRELWENVSLHKLCPKLHVERYTVSLPHAKKHQYPIDSFLFLRYDLSSESLSNEKNSIQILTKHMQLCFKTIGITSLEKNAKDLPLRLAIKKYFASF